MKVIYLLAVLLVLVGCDSPADDIYDFSGSPVDFKAYGYDYDLRLALRLGTRSKEAVLPARKCPTVLVSLFEYYNMTAECGSLRVPQDHDDLKSDPMTLGYLKSPEEFDSTKPLLIIEQGGPGFSSMMLAGFYLSEIQELSEDFNVLAIEQRGTEWTYPDVTCPEVIEAAKKSQDLKHDSTQTLNNIQSANEKCLASASKKMDLSQISSYQIAQDVIFGAKQMGFDQFNYFGVSYGTVVGQYLLHYAPEKLKNVVLDSPVLVGDPWIEDAIESKDVYYKKRFEKFVKINRPEVGVNAALEHFKKSAEKFDKMPLDVEVTINGVKDTYRVNKDYFVEMLLSSLDSESFMITSKLLEAADNLETNSRYGKIIFEPLLYFYLTEEVSSPDTTKIMYEKIICREFSYNFIDVRKAASNWTFLPEVLSEKVLNSWTQELSLCSLKFEKGDGQNILSQPVKTDKSVLVIGGEDDTTTIPRYVSDVSVDMPNAHKRVYEGLAHGVFPGKKCVSESVVNYLKSDDGSFTDECENKKLSEKKSYF